MSKYRDAILTDKGLDFVRNAVNGVIKIQFTKGIMSAEDHSKDSDQTIQGLTSLNGFVDSEPINYTLPVDEENVAVPLRFRNASMTENNYIDTIGIYATDGNNEILYSVIINDDPELFSAYNGKTPESVKLNSTTQVGRTEQVQTQVSPLGMVTEEEFHNVINNWNGDDKDHNFTAKLQHNGVDVVDSNELNQAISNFSGDNKNHNFTADLKYNGIEVATTNDTNNAFQNAVNTAKTYTDNKVIDVMGMPTQSIQPGDSFDNYAGKHVHLNINGINPYNDIGSGIGLPNQTMYGDFYTIPNINANPQIIQDNLGNRWYRIIGTSWVQIATGGSNIPIVHTAIKYINLINPNNNNYQFNNAIATYDSATNIVTLHGSIQATNNVNANDSIFEFNINSLNMNEITGNNLNSQTFAANTDATLQNIISTSNYAQSSGYTWNIEGCTINLGYNASLTPILPNGVPNGATLFTGNDISQIPVTNTNASNAPLLYTNPGQITIGLSMDDGLGRIDQSKGLLIRQINIDTGYYGRSAVVKSIVDNSYYTVGYNKEGAYYGLKQRYDSNYTGTGNETISSYF